jgi:hypothetical protein
LFYFNNIFIKSKFLFHSHHHQQMAAPSPKMDLKMLALPAMFFFNKKVDFTNPATVLMAQQALLTVAAAVLAIHFYCYQRANAGNKTKKVWVPPKPKPTLPFGLGPPAEPVQV